MAANEATAVEGHPQDAAGHAAVEKNRPPTLDFARNLELVVTCEQTGTIVVRTGVMLSGLEAFGMLDNACLDCYFNLKVVPREDMEIPAGWTYNSKSAEWRFDGHLDEFEETADGVVFDGNCAMTTGDPPPPPFDEAKPKQYRIECEGLTTDFFCGGIDEARDAAKHLAKRLDGRPRIVPVFEAGNFEIAEAAPSSEQGESA